MAATHRVPEPTELIDVLDRGIADAHRHGERDRVDDLLDKRGHIDELHTFLLIVAPYLGTPMAQHTT